MLYIPDWDTLQQKTFRFINCKVVGFLYMLGSAIFILSYGKNKFISLLTPGSTSHTLFVFVTMYSIFGKVLIPLVSAK
jgi:hypothetical protein